MILNCPLPHIGQCRTSMSRTRASRRAQPLRAGREAAGNPAPRDAAGLLYLGSGCSAPYADPFWPYRSAPFGYPYRHPRFAPHGGFGWGIQIRP